MRAVNVLLPNVYSQWYIQITAGWNSSIFIYLHLCIRNFDALERGKLVSYRQMIICSSSTRPWDTTRGKLFILWPIILFITPMGDDKPNAIFPCDTGNGSVSDWKGAVSHLAVGHSSVTTLRSQTSIGLLKKITKKFTAMTFIALIFSFLSPCVCVCPWSSVEVRGECDYIIQEFIHC